MNNKKINFIVGVVVLVALLILLFGVNFLKNTVPGEKKDIYHVVFTKVSTLTLGDPVRLNGVTMGRVKNIELWQYKVRVTFELKHSFKNRDGKEMLIRIPKNSDIRVQNIGLMGERQIEIHLGDSKEYFNPDDIIPGGKFDAGIAEAMGVAGQVLQEAEVLISTIKGVVDSTVGQKDFVPTFKNMVSDTRNIIVKLNALFENIDPKIRASIHNLESASTQMQILLNSGDGPIYTLLENGKTISTKVDSLVNHVNVITNSLHQIVGKINSNEGTLGAMINDTKFYGELRSTISNADSLLSIIKKQGLDVNVDFF